MATMSAWAGFSVRGYMDQKLLNKYREVVGLCDQLTDSLKQDSKVIVERPAPKEFDPNSIV